MTVVAIVISAFGIIPKRLGNKRTTCNHPDCSIIKICENTEKIPGDLRRLVCPVRNHKPTLV